MSYLFFQVILKTFSPIRRYRAATKMMYERARLRLAMLKTVHSVQDYYIYIKLGEPCAKLGLSQNIS